MNKKKIIIIASILGITVSVLSLGNLLSNNLDNYLSQASNSKTLALYIEDENSETGYIKSETTQFPTEGYILNIEKSTCTNGGELSQDLSTKKISLSVEHKSNCSLYFDKDLSSSEKTLTKLGKTAKEGTPAFGSTATTDETADGLYAMEDDYGTSYYYRGATGDNYVKFAGYFWRIIRINGDGSLRIIYDGTSAHGNGANSTNRLALQSIAWNTNYNDAKYVGYMYGGTNGSSSSSKEEAQTNETNTNVKTQIENWYKTNIADKGYDGYVSDNIFCNDRTIPGKTETGWSNDTGLGYGAKATAYGATARSNVWNTDANKVQPKFTCAQKNDAFTKEDIEKGNGKLEQKVGMITADEVVAAGSGKYGTSNSSYYLFKGPWYWSLSPYYMSASGNADVFIVNSYGHLGYTHVGGAGSIAPVISLSAEYVSTMSGNGTMGNPFEA